MADSLGLQCEARSLRSSDVKLLQPSEAGGSVPKTQSLCGRTLFCACRVRGVSTRSMMALCLEFADVYRLLLGTTLIATQILTGSGYGRALCLRSDGSVCCIHAMAEKCGCCEHGHGAKECSHEHDDDCQLVCCIAGNDEPDSDDELADLDTITPEFPLTSEVPCGCRHLPISSGPASTTQKSEQVKSSPRAAASEHGIGHDCSRTWLRCESLVVGCDPHWSPHCLSVGLTIVSSTVIRC